MGVFDLQGVQHTDRILGHVGQGVGRFGGEPQLVFQAGPQQVGFAQVVKVLAQTNIAVVHADHTKARIYQRLHHLRRPSHQLHAQPHDQ